MEKEDKSHYNDLTKSASTESHLTQLVKFFLIKEISRPSILIKIYELVFGHNDEKNKRNSSQKLHNNKS
jgi:hypothetical protein